MSSDDSELERLKAKRLAEMQKNITSQKRADAAPEPAENAPPPGPRETVLSRLGYRGLEVLENAESQFPNEAKMVTEKLAELIRAGEIREELDGGKLLLLFRTVGLHVKMNTTINIEQDGKFVSLSDKLRRDAAGGDGQRA